MDKSGNEWEKLADDRDEWQGSEDEEEVAAEDHNDNDDNNTEEDGERF